MNRCSPHTHTNPNRYVYIEPSPGESESWDFGAFYSQADGYKTTQAVRTSIQEHECLKYRRREHDPLMAYEHTGMALEILRRMRVGTGAAASPATTEESKSGAATPVVSPVNGSDSPSVSAGQRPPQTSSSATAAATVAAAGAGGSSSSGGGAESERAAESDTRRSAVEALTAQVAEQASSLAAKDAEIARLRAMLEAATPTAQHHGAGPPPPAPAPPASQ